ncbi:MAG: amidohydrolase family protein [Pseudomonadota bacterium]
MARPSLSSSQIENGQINVSDVLVPKALVYDRDAFGGRPSGDCVRGDLFIKDGRALRLEASATTDRPRLLIPALTEAHCHLDKCHTISRLGEVGGDLRAAIAAQMEDKRLWTESDLRERMDTGLSELATSGCQTVRSHIDWPDTGEPPPAWFILKELSTQYPDVTLQMAALTGIAQMADPSYCTSVARHVAASKHGVLGAFLLDHAPSDTQAGLANIFDAAHRFSLALDFHVDEGLGGFNGLEAICDAALRSRFDGPVLCGHAVSLMDRNAEDFQRIAGKLVKAGVAICALPTTNLYLQGRGVGTPDRRGITRLRELKKAGVSVVIASDNVADAFCPLGQHSPMAALHLAALAAHLDPPMGDWLPAITINASNALGVAPSFVDQATLTSLHLYDAQNTADLVAGRSTRHCVIDGPHNKDQL